MESDRKKRKVEFPEDFLLFWNKADKNTRMLAACIGYLHAKKHLLVIIECLRGDSHV